MQARDHLARDIIEYVMGHDILTQHGMAGLRKRLAIAIPDDVDLMYGAMLKRAGELMIAEGGTPEGRQLDILVAAIEAYEAKLPFASAPLEG